jgi:hypothetical protein
MPRGVRVQVLETPQNYSNYAPTRTRASQGRAMRGNRGRALVADGKTNAEIGAEMFLAERTVKNYVSSILDKLEVARRREAAACLARHSGDPTFYISLAPGGQTAR